MHNLFNVKREASSQAYIMFPMLLGRGCYNLDLYCPFERIKSSNGIRVRPTLCKRSCIKAKVVDFGVHFHLKSIQAYSSLHSLLLNGCVCFTSCLFVVATFMFPILPSPPQLHYLLLSTLFFLLVEQHQVRDQRPWHVTTMDQHAPRACISISYG